MAKSSIKIFLTILIIAIGLVKRKDWQRRMIVMAAFWTKTVKRQQILHKFRDIDYRQKLNGNMPQEGAIKAQKITNILEVIMWKKWPGTGIIATLSYRK